MAFRVFDNGMRVTDESRGITVKMWFGRFDDTGDVPYEYTESPPEGAQSPHRVDMLRFVFQTKAEKRKLDDYIYGGNSRPRLETVGTHIIESSVVDGLYQALGPNALEKVDLSHVKAALMEALYAAGAGGEHRSDMAPVFTVDFQ